MPPLAPLVHLAMMTISRAGGNCSLCNLKNSRNNLLSLFLLTAFPTFLPTVMPNRLFPDGFLCAITVK